MNDAMMPSMEASDRLGQDSPFAPLESAAPPVLPPISTDDWPFATIPAEQELVGAGARQIRSLHGGRAWSWTTSAGIKAALYVSGPAIEHADVDVLVYVHGLLKVCTPRPARLPGDLLADQPFGLPAIVNAAGRPMILVAPLFQNTITARWDPRGLGQPEALNALLAELPAEIAGALGIAAPAITRLLIAGHSAAGELLNALARAHASAAWSRGALATLSDLWLLDSTYTYWQFSIASYEALAAALPRLSIIAVFRLGSYTDQFTHQPPPSGVATRPIVKTVEHCDIPRTVLPRLLSDAVVQPAAQGDASAAENGGGYERVGSNEDHFEAEGAVHELWPEQREADQPTPTLQFAPNGNADPLITAGLTPAEVKAVKITSTFETGKPGGFGGLTGNFDGQGISFGLVNWAMKAGSLQPLLRSFAVDYPSRWTAIFSSDAQRFLRVISPKGDGALAAQYEFAASEMNELVEVERPVFAGGKRSVLRQKVWRVRQPWRGYFEALEKDTAFQDIQIRFVRPLLARAARYCREFGLTSERAFAFMFDTVSGNGGGWLDKTIGGERARRRHMIAARTRTQRDRSGQPPTEEELLTIIAGVLEETVLQRFAAAVRKRKLWFVGGEAPRSADVLAGLMPRSDVAFTISAPAAAVPHGENDEELSWLEFEGDNLVGAYAEIDLQTDAADEADERGDDADQGTANFAPLSALLENEAGGAMDLAGRLAGVAALMLGPPQRPGSTGIATAALQRALVALRYDIAIDGVFSGPTEAAVRSLQSKNGLAPTGIVDDRTKQAIAAALGQIAKAPAASSASLPDEIVRIAEQEYRRWHPAQGAWIETDAAAAQSQQQYWAAVGQHPSVADLRSKVWQSNHYWSAAFISWVMREAGAGKNFVYSAAHHVYVAAAKRNRIDGSTGNPFWAYRPTEVVPCLGDLVCKQILGSGASYDNIDDGEGRHTHCDVVTRVHDDGLRVIGGNVNNAVDTKPLIRLDASGKLRLDGAQGAYFAVLRCRGPVA